MIIMGKMALSVAVILGMVLWFIPCEIGDTRYMSKQKVKIEINTETSKWRFFDLELGVYSVEEWDTRIQAVKKSSKYLKKHNLMQKRKK